jgi:hypothetical protein
MSQWADDLLAGETLSTPDGQTETVVGTTSVAEPQGVAVYNLTVADDHTYFVEGFGSASNADGTTGSTNTVDAVWVHNNCVNGPFRDPEQPDYNNAATHLDHIRARALGGLDEEENLQELAAETNMRKGGIEGQIKADMEEMKAMLGPTSTSDFNAKAVEQVFGDEIESLGNSPPPRPMNPFVLDELESDFEFPLIEW